MADGSRFLQDCLSEPQELRAILARLLGPQRARVEEAAALLRAAAQAGITGPLICGMGSSFHGGHAIQAFFDAAGRPVRNADAGELLHFAQLPPKSTLLVLSRSGRSVEIVELVKKATAARAGDAAPSVVIGVTNDPESPLAKASRPVLLLGAPFDFNVSVTMYSGVALAGALAAAMAVGAWRDEIQGGIDRALAAAAAQLDGWRRQAEKSAEIGGDGSGWGARDAVTILLARGPGLAAALEARQLFEEAAKYPATALSTGAFRHGPNELVRPGCRVLLWLAGDARLRALDLGLAADLRKAGAKVALVGTALPRDAADLAFELPAEIDPAWRFLIELMPVRLLIEAISRARGVDCDRFDHCPFVVASEEGLGDGHAQH